MGTLVMMVGLPGSGKSTYAKKLLEIYQNWQYVSRDEIRYESVTDQAHYFDHEDEVYKEFCNRISMHLINGDTVIADATHLNKKSRFKLINSLSVKPNKVFVVVMKTPFKTCFNRNAKREGIIRVPDKNLYQMRNAYQVPDARFEDYIDKIIWVNE